MADTNKDSTFPKKILDKLPKDFIDETASMSDDELKKVVFDSEGNLYVIEKAKEADVDLTAAKERVKELSATYREGKSAQVAKIRYVLWLLEGRGVDLDNG